MQYWGYAKYQYCEIWKSNFAGAKAAALQCLDACPLDTIRKFINRGWRFMDAYRKGLTGKMAAWAVKKQKSHHAVSEVTMATMDCILVEN